MDDDDNSEDVIIDLDDPIIDAEDLVVGKIIVDDENYDEIIVLDLSRRECNDAWLV